MTQFEKQQAHRVYVEAGRNAFRIGIHILDNPYKQEPYRGLWEKGFKQARRDWDAHPLNPKRRPFKKAVARTFNIPSSSRFVNAGVRHYWQ